MHPVEAPPETEMESLARYVVKLESLVQELGESLDYVSRWCHTGHGAFPAKQCGMCSRILAALAKWEGR